MFKNYPHPRILILIIRIGEYLKKLLFGTVLIKTKIILASCSSTVVGKDSSQHKLEHFVYLEQGTIISQRNSFFI